MPDQTVLFCRELATAVHKTATFAAGCFWGVEDNFRKCPGVIDAEVGYTGGHTENPTYEDICRKGTGHAEAVKITYDADAVEYEFLVKWFLELHDPTQVNRQGPDIGDQYRSEIFVHDDEQQRLAEKALEEANASGRFKAPIATKVTRAGPWWRAEEYHQQYFAKMR